MKARLSKAVRLRGDAFGGICYVPHRDDFFALDKKVFEFVKSLPRDEWTEVASSVQQGCVRLALLGICETNPPTHEIAYSGPAFLGTFIEIPTVAEPLVLNCFATAHCPLKCLYCHADDLMQEFRAEEDDAGLESVIRTAKLVPAMVAVITGGDPLTRPDRATSIIEQLAGQKALVLDTSGVGDIRGLVPLLKQYSVHVRVSLDAISEVNARTRPGNAKYGSAPGASDAGARRTIDVCVAEGIPLTVQTVVSNRNDNMDELRQLRSWLIARHVRHWVLHIAVKGGSARRLESQKSVKPAMRGVLPSKDVHNKLWGLVEETIARNLPIDIRCTDTDLTPNSVLLVGSTGSLYTEGYAHNGKVLLYDGGSGRPDLLRALWPHIDRFGHARRYLNWNPWFFNGKSLSEICYDVPLPDQLPAMAGTPVESEAKHRVADVQLLHQLLTDQGFVPSPGRLQRDEYFDTSSLVLRSNDFVVRIRKESDVLWVSLKGPRLYSGMEYLRIELEIEAASETSIRDYLASRGMTMTWYFEKRRIEYGHASSPLIVAIDEIPDVGHFVELEGPLEAVRSLAAFLNEALSHQESRNYQEIYLANQQEQGMNASDVRGAEFAARL